MPLPTRIEPAPLRSEADILHEEADSLVATRFDQNPHILVLDFHSLSDQGQAFNRIAAFLEKRGLPRDRVLTDTELAAAIRADNATAATYYYGHDYREADLARFYATAARQHLALSRAEQRLHALLALRGVLAEDAVISIPPLGSDKFVDASGRASLLRHELSHGEYFTNPGFADYVRRFWASEMTEADRAAFRGFLSRQGYDPANDDLMANETQAHLMNTTDRRYFSASACGIPAERLQVLRAAFLAGMPEGWLRDAMLRSRDALPG